MPAPPFAIAAALRESAAAGESFKLSALGPALRALRAEADDGADFNCRSIFISPSVGSAVRVNVSLDPRSGVLFNSQEVALVCRGGDEGTSVMANLFNLHRSDGNDAGIMRFFTTREARELRLVHSEFREAVEHTQWDVPRSQWGSSAQVRATRIGRRGTPIRLCLERWRQSFPHAIAADVSGKSSAEDSGLADEDVAQFLRGIRSLDISHSSGITDGAFRSLRGTRRLIMQYCTHPSLSESALCNLRGIEELDLGGCTKGAVTPAALLQLRGVRALDLASTDYSLHSLVAAIGSNDIAQSLRRIDECGPMDEHVLRATMYGWSALHLASLRGQAPVVRRLLERGADADVLDPDGQTPLHWACIDGFLDVALLLLACEADVNARDAQGTTPLMIVRENGHTALATALIAHGAEDEKDGDDDDDDM